MGLRTMLRPTTGIPKTTIHGIKRSRSVLCLPIVKQARLVGVLYLENNLAPLVFTPDRVALLQLLASQAAISLENAALYTDLQLQVGILQQLPVSAWTLKPDGHRIS